MATPGGWRLVGRTPMAMFRPDRPQMNVLQIGDRVRFRPDFDRSVRGTR